MNRRSSLFWIVLVFGGLVGLFILCGVGIVIIGILSPSSRSVTTSQRSVSTVPAPTVEPTQRPDPTSVPTDMPRPTVQQATEEVPTTTPTVPTPPTDPPVPTVMPTPASASDRYLAIAMAGIKTPLVRPGLPAGEWKVLLFGPDDVQITLPLSVGTNEQTVRLGKLAIAQVVKALFDQAPELTRVNVVGTTPTTGGELPAISIVLTRDQFATWDGLAENLGKWNVSQRLQ